MIHEVISIKAPGYSEEGKLYTYFWEETKELYPGKLRPVILICPGGGYQVTSDREAEGVALRFMAMGYHTAVLRYSVAPAVYPVALLQAAKSIALLREHAQAWNIDKEKIIIQGFSAGGHLAASLGVFWNKKHLAGKLQVDAREIKPNAMMLSYPVITAGEFAHRDSFRTLLGNSYQELLEEMSLEKQVDKDTPVTFLWHSFTDQTVPVENSLLFVQSLRKYNISTEFHMYPVGRHGIGLANSLTDDKDGSAVQKECESWSTLAGIWLESQFGKADI